MCVCVCVCVCVCAFVCMPEHMLTCRFMAVDQSEMKEIGDYLFSLEMATAQGKLNLFIWLCLFVCVCVCP